MHQNSIQTTVHKNLDTVSQTDRASAAHTLRPGHL